MFSNLTIGDNLGEHSWPVRSPDLTSCDFFLWGWMKEEGYRRMPFADLSGLGTAIRDDICAGPDHSRGDVLQSLPLHTSITKRFEELKNRGGRHIEQFL